VLPARFVEVAIDAAGAGGARPYTYHLPPDAEDLVPGEAVLVPFGRRQSLGIILGDADDPGIETKAVVSRVRADGPLLAPLQLELARWIADHYLAPPSTVIRAMLPPGLLERLDLVAERTAAAAPADGPVAADGPVSADEAALLEALDEGPAAARSIRAPEGRANLMRRLRALEARGLVTLDWTLTSAAGPRFERWATLTVAGRDAAGRLAAGERIEGRPLGPRQRAALDELAVLPPGQAMPAADLGNRHGSAAVAGLTRRGLVEIAVRERPRRPLAARPPGLRGARPAGSALTPEQAEAVALIERSIAGRDPTPILLDGVTGGGKTAIYLEAAAATLAGGRPVLVLVPEIALALPFVDRIQADLDVRVALLHSGLGDGERGDEWRRVRSGDVDVVVGTRLAVLAPLADVGLVVVDEEHEATYKSDRTPRLQARDTAVRLAELAGAALVLGSATPAVDTIGRARAGEIRRVALPRRPSGQAPTVEVVDLRVELEEGHRRLLSRRLEGVLAALEARDQAILVINRRGSASVVLCRDCGHVLRCPDCDRPLVYHQAGGTLRCHACGRAAPTPSRCPNCGSPRIRYLGGGTQRVEQEVRDRFPALRVGRLDRDVAERRGGVERVVDAFVGGGLDVLVGTSLVTKGLDIPGVTLVGVVSADVALNLPDERAAERTYQLLAQAVGRAGRGDRPGLAIIQSYQPEHPAITAVATGRAEAFYDAELELRRRFGSPPFGRLVKLTVGLQDRDAAETTAREMVGTLRDRAETRGDPTLVVGPAPAFIARRADRWRWNVVLRGPDPVALLDGGPGAPWSVDVDPESLL
jgi:primosomal protein N' (replication factor Y)